MIGHAYSNARRLSGVSWWHIQDVGTRHRVGVVHGVTRAKTGAPVCNAVSHRSPRVRHGLGPAACMGVNHSLHAETPLLSWLAEVLFGVGGVWRALHAQPGEEPAAYPVPVDTAQGGVKDLRMPLASM